MEKFRKALYVAIAVAVLVAAACGIYVFGFSGATGGAGVLSGAFQSAESAAMVFNLLRRDAITKLHLFA